MVSQGKTTRMRLLSRLFATAPPPLWSGKAAISRPDYRLATHAPASLEIVLLDVLEVAVGAHLQLVARSLVGHDDAMLVHL